METTNNRPPYFRDVELLQGFIYCKGLWHEYEAWCAWLEREDPLTAVASVAGYTYANSVRELQELEETYEERIRYFCGKWKEDYCLSCD